MTMLSMAQSSNTALWLAYFKKRTGSRVTLLECSRGGKWKRLPGEIIVSRLMLALGTTSPPLVGPAGCNVRNSTLWRSQQCAMCNVIIMCSVIKCTTSPPLVCRAGCNERNSTTGHVLCAMLQNAQLYHHWFEIVVCNARNSTMCYMLYICCWLWSTK